jgi:modulator of FtsH protease HflC
MQHSDTRLVLRPDSDFFRYFSDPGGTPPSGGAATSSGPAAAATSTPPHATSATK